MCQGIVIDFTSFSTLLCLPTLVFNICIQLYIFVILCCTVLYKTWPLGALVFGFTSVFPPSILRCRRGRRSVVGDESRRPWVAKFIWTSVRVPSFFQNVGRGDVSSHIWSVSGSWTRSLGILSLRGVYGRSGVAIHVASPDRLPSPHYLFEG